MDKEKEVRSSLACAIGTVTRGGSPKEAIWCGDYKPTEAAGELFIRQCRGSETYYLIGEWHSQVSNLGKAVKCGCLEMSLETKGEASS